MDLCGDDEIRRLLRLKRYEQPPPGYFENFLHEFRRRQRERLVQARTGITAREIKTRRARRKYTKAVDTG